MEHETLAHLRIFTGPSRAAMARELGMAEETYRQLAVVVVEHRPRHRGRQGEHRGQGDPLATGRLRHALQHDRAGQHRGVQRVAQLGVQLAFAVGEDLARGGLHDRRGGGLQELAVLLDLAAGQLAHPHRGALPGLGGQVHGALEFFIGGVPPRPGAAARLRSSRLRAGGGRGLGQRGGGHPGASAPGPTRTRGARTRSNRRCCTLLL